MSATLKSTLFLALLLLPTSGVLAQVSSPPPSSGPPGEQTEFLDDAVTAVVVKSWGGGSVLLIWQYLNDNWNLHGETQVVIDYTTLLDVASFTLGDLQKVGADVVIVGNPAGGTVTWSQDEMDALATYAGEGHNLVGTSFLYQWTATDNRGLAPLWGHRSDLTYNNDVQIPAEATTSILHDSHCLFVSITDPMAVGGWPNAQVPADDFAWDSDDMNGATIVGLSDNERNVVTDYDAGAYHAYYISYMPEYQDGSDTDATQWVYNAIVCSKISTPVREMSWGEVKEAYK